MDRAAFSVDGDHKVALRAKVSLDQQFDVVHKRTTALVALKVKEFARWQSQNALTNQINSTEVVGQQPGCSARTGADLGQAVAGTAAESEAASSFRSGLRATMQQTHRIEQGGDLVERLLHVEQNVDRPTRIACGRAGFGRLRNPKPLLKPGPHIGT